MGGVLTPEQFISTWKHSDLNERQGAHIHFNGLCDLLGVPKPTGTSLMDQGYGFEINVDKAGGGGGYADAWKRNCFAWEYKSPGKDLGEALKQLRLYASDLENPPLLIVSDMRRIELHTNWTSMVQEKHALQLEDLADARLRQKLKWAFDEASVEHLKPKRSANATTEEVARKFVAIAQSLRDQGHDPEKVAHFVNRMVFCMFAEDVDLLPKRLFERMLEASLGDSSQFVANAEGLFGAMANKNGRVGFDAIQWFNGGLFEDRAALPLTADDIRVALEATRANWSEINPSIMGTLFERGLDPGKRSQLGAHYTDAEKIMMIVRPVIIEPLLREWAEVRGEIEVKAAQAARAKSASAKTKTMNEAQAMRIAFVERLKNFRVLDPACGSGNFLYLALKALKDIEFRVNFEAEELGLPPAFPAVGPECVKGIEINPFAAELARVSVWIGEIQWMREKNFGVSDNPVLKSLNTIECRDALLNPDGTEAEWPEADVIIGNPPFLGSQRMIDFLGEPYVRRVRPIFEDRLGSAVDLVCYWFDKAWRHISESACSRVGLVATNSIRGGTNRTSLKPITEGGRIFEAWSDEPWVVDGASVRVSVICFDGEPASDARLDGSEVAEIFSDLTSTVDIVGAKRLATNKAISFQGPVKVGPFDVDGDVARSWLLAPRNPDGSSNTEVLRPWANGLDITRRPEGKWIIDFGQMSEQQAAMFEAPFRFVQEHVRPVRLLNRDSQRRANWWRLGRSGEDLKRATNSLQRQIVSPRVAKHRIFVWAPAKLLADCQLIAIARDDDTTFGILHSKLHELWSLRMCTWLGVGNDPRYAPTTCFETFPFPEGLTPNIPATDYANDPRGLAIAAAAARLNELRENWLNPPDLVRRVPEVVSGYPDRVLPIDVGAAAILKNRTLTKLYNERPAWLDHAHKELDAAVAAAYGWPKDLTDDRVLERLFALNQERAAKLE
ncbi:class I SAM-dependent DNA methyltransferase [Hyphomicrobium sp. CS1GBMeth3]|uniref:class I SAM-dependent DNA methyltransferase n=1 Tax=Hyphomicrobium sp. CS1GBMeth3 TaxID=1892845 RepID=UPI000AD847E6|nr:class I SAM-dependent DNA methyltransferase [Hyphomicrobium sp. CS1GBMeth3]